MSELLRLLISAFLFQGPALAQEGDFEIPPPPPMMDDYDEGMIEEIPPEDYIDGPVYEPPPLDADNIVPGFDPNAPANSSNFGFSNSGDGDANGAPPTGRPSFRGRPGGGGPSGPTGGGSFGNTSSGKLKFEIVDGVYWEEGKKRTRSERK